TCRSVRCLADTSPERARSTTASSSPRSIGADTTASSGWSIARPATPRRDWMAGSREQPGPIASDELLGQLPADWPEDPLPAIRAALRDSGRTFCVLDDDPTGTQTVHDALVVTNWSEPDLGEALAGGRQFFYILTKIRSDGSIASRTESRSRASFFLRRSKSSSKSIPLSAKDTTQRPPSVRVFPAACGGRCKMM